MLTAYICGAYLDYDKVPYVVIALPAVFLGAMTMLPEPPNNLIRQHKIEVRVIMCNNQQLFTVHITTILSVSQKIASILSQWK